MKKIGKNILIVLCSMLASSIVWLPAGHFGSVAIMFITSGSATRTEIELFRFSYRIASFLATSVLAFNAWQEFLKIIDRSYKLFLRKLVFF